MENLEITLGELRSAYGRTLRAIAGKADYFDKSSAFRTSPHHKAEELETLTELVNTLTELRGKISQAERAIVEAHELQAQAGIKAMREFFEKQGKA